MTKEYVIVTHWPTDGGKSEQVLIQTNILESVRWAVKVLNVTESVVESDDDDAAVIAYTYPMANLISVQNHITGHLTALEKGGFEFQNVETQFFENSDRPGQSWRYERDGED